MKLLVFSNSVDLDTSVRTLEISKKFRSNIPFVGIHPEIFAHSKSGQMDRSSIDSMTDELAKIVGNSSGIGEMGLDPKYGSPDLQDYLFEKMLQLSQTTSLPVTLHCRESVSIILQKLSSYNLRGNILFHWFAGTESELSQITQKGFYCSFGPSVLFSKRLARLLQLCNPNLIMSETDAPTPFNSLISENGSPLLVASVVFKMASVLKISFDAMRERLLQNSNAYLENANLIKGQGKLT